VSLAPSDSGDGGGYWWSRVGSVQDDQRMME
jgi:hypothetical protein